MAPCSCNNTESWTDKEALGDRPNDGLPAAQRGPRKEARYTEGGTYLGQVGVFTFPDNAQLAKVESGLFTPGGQQAQAAPNSQVLWMYQEESNVDMLREMTQMMTAERSLQSGAQVLKLYDSLLTKATTEVGRL